MPDSSAAQPKRPAADARVAPADPAELAGIVAEAYAAGTPFIRSAAEPVSTMDCRPDSPAWACRSPSSTRVIDYPARDMTITVEAGITLAALADCWPPNGNGCRSTARSRAGDARRRWWPRP